MKKRKMNMLLLFGSIVLLVGTIILYNTVLQSPQITEVEYQNNIAKTEKVKTDNIDKIIKGIPNKSYYLYIGRSTCPYCRKFSPVIKELSSKHKVFYLDVENFNFDKNTENLIDKTLNIETIPYITYYNNGKLTKSINDSSATIEDVLALSLEK